MTSSSRMFPHYKFINTEISNTNINISCFIFHPATLGHADMYAARASQPLCEPVL